MNNNIENNNTIETANLTAALENIQDFVAQVAAAPSKYKVEIADTTGHTTLADLSMEEATESVLSRVENKAHWVYINGAPFQFEGSKVRTEANKQKLQQELLNNPAAQVMLTGVVMGGEAGK